MAFPELPRWFERPRDEQTIAAERAIRAFQNGYRLVLVDAPTGVGKSAIPEMVRRRMEFRKTIYMCSGIELEDQFVNSFPYSANIRGRDNYPTELYPAAFSKRGLDRISCRDCTYRTDAGCHFCSSKGNCTYEVAKIRALNDDLTCMNSSYFLSEVNYVGQFKDWDFVAIDEADTMDQQLMKLIEIRVPRKIQRLLGISAPRHSTKVESWARWYVSTLQQLGAYVGRINVKDLEKPDEIRLYQRCRSLHQQLKEAGDLDDHWSYVGNDNDEIVFRPVEPAPWGKAKLWDHGKFFLAMSATLLSGDVIADELGFDEPYDVVYLPSPFPKENRPIRFAPIVDMGYKNRVVGMERLAQGVAAICEQNADKNVLVHTHTFSTARYLQEYMHSPRVLTYSGKHNRHETLETFKRERGRVLLAPSMERGIDLPDDQCRVVIVAQLPIPYTADRQINKRVYGRGERGHRWLRAETMRALVQMTGRGVRHESDWCDTWVLDSRAPSFVERCRREGIAPRWWTDAVVQGPWIKQLGLQS